ncbi:MULTISPECIES: efflux RND transporter periplasmic adaptor subunit [Rhizobium/Agrobacterium group]|uniref:Efflux transporter periplasmic adaptor subunit n=1 Tax=Pararhizobium antarcticum TaxID=1798805 RepID=A0A657LQ24_9HYPH|nr:efflux transporter periplasmic adaptor subunit [Pararhizobium antarcticum]OJF97471.1 efflux transporter periplasmic adaptor subunit [Rhizobium sp. 58]
MRKNRLTLTAAASVLLVLAGCQEDEQKQAPPAYPPSQVSFVETRMEPIPITNDLPGRVAPTRIAEVRPRATGIIIKRVFEQGSLVKEGDVLYQIDPASFQVQVDSAEATLRRAEAVRTQAKQTADRQDQLRRSNAASAQQFDDATAQLAQAEADVAIASASLATAQLNLQYTNVTAPISGRIGRALITEGALVSANGTENLATIQQLDPVYADFTQSATDLIRLRKGMQDGALSGDKNEAKVRLLMDDGEPYAHVGKLLFSEAAVDETTGQVTLRGEFPNPDGDLLPGMYVRVLIEQGVRNDAISLPIQAIQRDTAGNAQVYIAKADDTLELRSVRLGQSTVDKAVVIEGLKTGDRVVVEGFQKIGPGAKVVPTPWNPDGATGQAADKPQAEGENAPAAQPAADGEQGEAKVQPAETAK